MLEIVNLCKSYGKTEVLKNLNLNTSGCKLISILGRSGSGKSTMLKLIAGLENPEQGSITFDSKTPKRLIIFQDYHSSIYPWLTVFQNVSLAKKSASKNGSHQIKELISLVGLEGHEDKYPYNLSGGQIQRVALARALHFEPDILLLDEPFSSLDMITKSELQDILKQIAFEKKIKCILVTHDIEEALYLTERIYILNKSDNGILRFDSPEFCGSEIKQDCKLEPLFTSKRKEIIEYLEKS